MDRSWYSPEIVRMALMISVVQRNLHGLLEVFVLLRAVIVWMMTEGRTDTKK